jgi:hypothetical protein
VASNVAVTPLLEPVSPRRMRKRWPVVGVIVVALIVGLVAPTGFGGWAPLAHWTCQDSQPSAVEPIWIPAVVVNAPYGGSVAGNGSIPAGFIANGAGFGSSEGLPAANGSVGGVFLHVLIQATTERTVLTWGAGTSASCTEPYEITAQTDFNGSQVYSGILSGPGNLSDSSEAHQYNFSSSPGDRTAYFSNGFDAANEDPISTCGNSEVFESVVTSNLHIAVPVTFGGVTQVLPFTLPFGQSFSYRFPANFGTWQIDNLSAPGGPGGGWAFSYIPCS